MLSLGFMGSSWFFYRHRATEEDNEDKEVKGSDYEISVDSTMVVTLKEEQKTALRTFFFPSGVPGYTTTPTIRCKSLSTFFWYLSRRTLTSGICFRLKVARSLRSILWKQSWAVKTSYTVARWSDSSQTTTTHTTDKQTNTQSEVLTIPLVFEEAVGVFLAGTLLLQQRQQPLLLLTGAVHEVVPWLKKQKWNKINQGNKLPYYTHDHIFILHAGLLWSSLFIQINSKIFRKRSILKKC